MPHYEHIVIARQDISQQQVETLNEQIKTQIEGDGGTVVKTEYWGLRQLAYKIKKNRKGHYTLFAITCEPAAIKEVERQLSINEDVLRLLTLRVDHVDASPSVVVSRATRERRYDDEYEHQA